MPTHSFKTESDRSPWRSKFGNQFHFQKIGAFLGVAVLVIVGIVIISSRAAGPFIVLETESAAISGPASVGNDAQASGGRYVQLSPGTGGGSSASTCPGTGVAINPTDNAQTVVNAHAAGTAYIVKAGTHQSNFAVVPKAGDKYCGEAGNVIDGGRTLQKAFSGTAANVTLDSLVVQNYNTGRQFGAIGPAVTASGWFVRNVTSRNNYWAGISLADGMKVYGGHFNDNDQLGIASGDPAGSRDAIGAVLDGLDTDLTTFDGPEMARNRHVNDTCQFEGGGMKSMSDITVRNVYVHDNDCFGLWADINDKNTLVEYNRVENNGSPGIYYEISQDACIRYNQVSGNGKTPPNNIWWWGGGITIPASFNVEVYGNSLSNNFNGITGVQQDRFDSTPPAHLLDHVYIHNNTVSDSGQSGVGADNGANLAARNIVYKNNTYQNGHQGRNDTTGTGYPACANLGFADVNPYSGSAGTAAGAVNASISVAANATYHVWSRIMVPDQTNNSFLLQIDNNPAVTVGDAAIPSGAWTWVDYQNGASSSKVDSTLTAGAHTVKLTGRESNVKVDRLLLLSDSCVPSGNGDNCVSAPPPPTPPPPPPSSGPGTVSFKNLSDAQTITGSVPVEAVPANATGVSKMEFYIDNTLKHTENTAPYCLNTETTAGCIPWDTKQLSNGSHVFKAVMTYSSGTAQSQITLNVQNGTTTPPPATPPPPPPPAAGSGTGLTGIYYDDIDFTGPNRTRLDPTVNFNWGTTASGDAIVANIVGPFAYSIRWTGKIVATKSESYTFYTQSDDGVRLWVKGVRLVNNWTNHTSTENKGSISLTAGQKYDIKLEYYQNGGPALSQLRWSSPSTPKAVIPTSQLFAK